MIHAICDFCGKDCDRTATLLSMTQLMQRLSALESPALEL